MLWWRSSGSTRAAGLRELHQAHPPAGSGLDAASTAASRPPSRAGAAFVGRDRELAELVDGLEDVFAGRGRLFLLAGEPGIGKSRLADELTDARARAGAACWSGAAGRPAARPRTGRGSRPCAPTSATATPTRSAHRARDRRAPTSPRSCRSCGALPRPPAAVARSSPRARASACSTPPRSSCARPPNVRRSCWCSTTSTPPTPVAPAAALPRPRARLDAPAACLPPIATSTRSRRDPRSPTCSPRCLGSGGTSRLSLAGLDGAEWREYVVLTAPEVASPELGRAPARGDRRQSAFRRRDRAAAVGRGRAARSAGRRLAIPQSVRDVIARRLAHLSARATVVLVVASVLGREFALDMLGRLGGVPSRRAARLARRGDRRRPRFGPAGQPGPPPLRARADPGHALRRAHECPPYPAAPLAVDGLEQLHAELARAAPRRARAPLDRRRRSRKGLRYARQAADARARSARLRGGRAPLRPGARGARPERSSDP